MADVEKWDIEVDFVAVGTGAGALTASLVARDAGLRVAIFEKADKVGGGTAYSGGALWIPFNARMKKHGTHDSVEDAMRYLESISGGRWDPTIARAYVENAATVIGYLEEHTPLVFVTWPNSPDYFAEHPGGKIGRVILAHPIPVGAALTEAEKTVPGMALVRVSPHDVADLPSEAWVAGRALIGGIWKAVLDRDIPYYTGARACRLHRGGGRVVGLDVEYQGKLLRVRAKRGVLLNTGGFEWNKEMFLRFVPGPEVHPFTPPSNSGDGHIMGMELGAATAMMDQILYQNTVQIPGETHEGEVLYRLLLEGPGRPHAIMVNRLGRRFADESHYMDVARGWCQFNNATREFPNLPTFFVCDERYRQRYSLPKTPIEGRAPDWIKEAKSLRALAGAIAVDPDGLEDQVKRFNEQARRGLDPEFGRGTTAYGRFCGDPEHETHPTLGPVEKAPFYAFEIHPGSAGFRGGLVISPRGEVKDVRGNVIPGLYACGNTAAMGQLAGSGYGSGQSIGHAMVFGYLAVQEIVKTANQE